MEINYTVNVKEYYLIQGSYVLQQYWPIILPQFDGHVFD